MPFPRGYTLGTETGRPACLEHRGAPCTNLARTLIALGLTRRTPVMTSLREVGNRYPSMMFAHLRPR